MLTFDSFTKDPDVYRKLLIGSLLALVGVGFIPLAGWRLEHIRRSIREDDPFLPEWDDFGKYILDGLQLAALNLIWFLPVVLLIIAVAVTGVFMSGSFASQEDFAVTLLVLNLCTVGLVFVYTLPVLVLTVPAYGILADSGSFAEAVNPANAFHLLRADTGGFIVSGLIGMLATSLLTSLGTLLCLIGIYPAYAASFGITGQLYGRAYRQAKAKMEQEQATNGFLEDDLPE